jgi:hypothetical protein
MGTPGPGMISLITKNISVSQRKPCAAWKVQSFPGECRHQKYAVRDIGVQGEGRKSVEAPITVFTRTLLAINEPKLR